MELVKQELGTEGMLTVKIAAGKLVVSIAHKHASGELALTATEDAGYFFDKLAEAIPGPIDDAVLGLIKEAVKKI